MTEDTFLIKLFENYCPSGSEKEELNTNIIYYHPERKRSLYIPPNRYEVFLKKISEEIFDRKMSSTSFLHCFNERGQEIKKFIMDFDWKLKEETYKTLCGSSDRLMTDDKILEILKVLKKILSPMYDLPDLEVFIMKKPKITHLTLKEKDVEGKETGREISYVKDGLHLAIPELYCDENTLLHIRKGLIFHLFRKPEATYKEVQSHAEEIIDKQVLLATPWMIYGCSKTGKDPYLINYSFKLSALTPEFRIPEPEHKPFVYRLRMLYHSTRTPFHPDFDTSTIELLVESREKRRNQVIGAAGAGGKKYTPEELTYYWKILDALEPKYYTDRQEWLHIGFILSDISRKSKEMYELWIRFSKKGSSFEQDAADRVWLDGESGIWTEDSLFLRLKRSNIQVFNELSSKNLIQKIRLHNGPWTEDDVANILYYFARDKFKMCSLKIDDQRVFEFDEHIWKLRPNSVSLNTCLKKGVKLLFCDAKKAVDAELDVVNRSDCESNEENAKAVALKKKSDSIQKVILSLGSDRYKKNVINAVFDYLNDYNFLDTTDKKYYKFAFKNGVFDGLECKFGPGNPDDNLTQQCPHKFYPASTDGPHLKYFQEIDEFYATLFPDPEVARFVKHMDALSLFATINDSRTFLGYGHGQNGKTKRTTLLHQGFGDHYYCEINVGVFTQGRKKSGEANSELAKIRNKRSATTSEIGKNEQLSMHCVKELTGGGQITGGRDLYETAKAGTFKAQTRIWWQLNYLPKIDCDIDDGVARRLRVLKYVVQFVDPDDIRIQKDPYHYKARDDSIDRKIEIWAEFFPSYLVHIYTTEIFGKPPLPEPASIKKATSDYLASINMLENFKNECFEVGSGDDTVTFEQAWNTFQVWKKQALFYENLSRKELIEYLKNRFEKYFNGQDLEGLRLKK